MVVSFTAFNGGIDMALTKSQQLVYDYLCATMAERAVPPSVREICAATGLRSTSTVHSHLKSLEAMGYITRDAGLNRSIHIAGAAAAKQVPILGKVTAGLPILAVEDIEGYIPYPDKSGKELFALHVDGFSMKNAGILDGDYVIAEKTPVAENGEIALNMITDAESGFYDGLSFHRIIAGFMMQGGDPLGNGTGGSENNIVGEFSSNGIDNDLSHERGVISMARSSDPNSASSQFFICHEDSDFLDGDYAAFGVVTEGLDVVDAVCTEAQPTDSNGTIPAEAQPVIKTITIRTK
jgi:SOS regulatory protein LexA